MTLELKNRKIMRKINLFIARIVSKLFPHTRVVNFTTKDDIVTSTMFHYSGSVYFSLLESPTTLDVAEGLIEKSKRENRNLFKYKYKQPFVVLQFYKTDSIDKFINLLQKLKEEMVTQEALDALESGTYLEFVYDKEPSKNTNGYKVNKYSATFKIKEDERIQGKEEEGENND
jgi:hypothetical protein